MAVVGKRWVEERVESDVVVGRGECALVGDH